jgi:SAM-dependent MidA family methyltransferase
VLGNEVLDAIPAHILHKTQMSENKVGFCERGVAFEAGFVWRDAALSDAKLAEHLPDYLPIEYITEVNPAASALVSSLV